MTVAELIDALSKHEHHLEIMMHISSGNDFFAHSVLVSREKYGSSCKTIPKDRRYFISLRGIDELGKLI
jgi:hypothetical protein